MRMCRLLALFLAACALAAGATTVLTPRVVHAVLYEQGAILTSVANINLTTSGLHSVLIPVRDAGSADTATFQAVVEPLVGGDDDCSTTRSDEPVILPSAWIAQTLFERVSLAADAVQERAAKERVALLEEEAALLALALSSLQRELVWVEKACDKLVDAGANDTGLAPRLFDTIGGCASKLLQLSTAVRNTTQRLSQSAEQHTLEAKRLAALRAKVLMMRLVIRVSVAGSFRVRISCVDSESSWEPWYEVALSTHDATLAVRYAASVTQRSTANWTNVTCELCTGRIQRNTSFPVMDPWRVSLHNPWQLHQQQQQQRERQGVSMSQSAMFGGAAAPKFAADRRAGSASAGDEDAAERADDGGAPAAAVVQNAGGFFATFLLPEPVTFASAGGHQLGALRTDIATFVLPNVTLLTVAVPRFRNHAFLRAVVRNDSPFAMLSARGRAFVDGALVGDVAVPFVSAGGVSTIDLGIDHAVQVSRRLLHQETSEVSKHFFSSATEKRANKEMLLSVENRRRTGADVVVRERLPLVEDGRLEILVSEPFLPDTLNAFAKTAADNGAVTVRNNVTFLKQHWMLEWKVFVPAQQRVDIPLRMTAKWPAAFDVDWGNE